MVLVAVAACFLAIYRNWGRKETIFLFLIASSILRPVREVNRLLFWASTVAVVVSVWALFHALATGSGPPLIKRLMAIAVIACVGVICYFDHLRSRQRRSLHQPPF
jgi:hypothetical protein